MHVVERCAAWAEEWRAQPIPAEVLHHARRALIDWHAALLPGSVVAPATLLKKAFAEEFERGYPRALALVNGSAAHTVEVDDIFRDGIYHPGAPTIAAALSLKPENPLRAIVVGYEISTRIGAAMGRAHYRFWHNTGTIGCFGACAAAAEVLKLDRKRFAHALATVATFAAGLQQAFRMDSMSKPLHAGHAAEAGVTAALAAREGVIGSLDVMEGEAGFGRAMGEGPDWEKALATLGRDFHITRMTFKNHACCGHTFAAIDGALALKAKMGLQAKEIDRVDVATYRAGVEVAHYEDPRTPAEARFSLKYVVATALTHGSVRLAAFESPRLTDPGTRALMGKMSVSLDPLLDATFPRQRAARVAIEAHGRREEWLQPTRKGDPDAPLSDAELEDKFLELASPVLGDAPAQALLKKLWATR
ncbi:MAG TPA: MmgE/PrpD family protein [Burkholderiales bacterium]|jgi:2-methylcitrate dehydratase PrpD|nr:MmgE/PrpD family protein [Burkholderiales bacterium]